MFQSYIKNDGVNKVITDNVIIYCPICSSGLVSFTLVGCFISCDHILFSVDQSYHETQLIVLVCTKLLINFFIG